MQIAMTNLGMWRRLGQKFGPYLMLEMLLPGGTLLAMLLFLYQRGKLPATRVLASRVEQGNPVLRPCSARSAQALAGGPGGLEVEEAPINRSYP
jgi:hypothetical protein